MNSIRRLLGKIHLSCLKVYDKFTAKECEVSVGDIILRRAEIDHCQFLLISRKLDVEAFVGGRDKNFPYQNTVSRAIYGKRHKEVEGNRYFSELIKSYQDKGYDPTSFLTVDNECRLIDGNHRMGINLYMGIERMNVHYLKRKSPFLKNLDSYYKLGMSSSFMEEVYAGYCNVQSWLIESGNTFCCVLKGQYEKGPISLAKDLKLMTTVLNVLYLHSSKNLQSGLLIQFSLNDPRYSVKKGKLYSRQAEEIEQLLNDRKIKFGMNVDILVSKNCIEGKSLWEENLKY